MQWMVVSPEVKAWVEMEEKQNWNPDDNYVQPI